MDSFNEFEKDGAFAALRDFCERNGVVVKASYLMITQTHLSRIRKEISFEK